MKLVDLGYAAIVMCLVGIIGVSIYGEFMQQYNKPISASDPFSNMANGYKAFYDSQSDMKAKIQGGAVSDTNAVDNMIKGGYTSIRLNPFSWANVMMNASNYVVYNSGYVDPQISNAVPLLLGVGILFGILAYIFRMIPMV